MGTLRLPLGLSGSPASAPGEARLWRSQGGPRRPCRGNLISEDQRGVREGWEGGEEGRGTNLPADSGGTTHTGAEFPGVWRIAFLTRRAIFTFAV